MTTTTGRSSTSRRTVSPQERAARDAARAEKLTALHAEIVTGVDALTTSEAWQAMLRTAAKFHHYSLRNQLLIAAQAPHATRVAGFTTWQRLGRQVLKGERAIAILAPRTTTVRAGGETTPDATAGAQTWERGGTEAGVRQVLRGVSVAYVFDVSQTEGDPLPNLPAGQVTGDVPAGLWDGLAAQITAHGYTLERGDCGTADGYTDPTTHRVRIAGTDRAATATNTLAHELAHLVCGHVTDLPTYRTCRGRCEIEAESVAYVVTGAYGLDTSASTFGYVAGWAQGHTDQVLAAAENVTRAARTILDTILDTHTDTLTDTRPDETIK